jgi:hypothetical protein
VSAVSGVGFIEQFGGASIASARRTACGSPAARVRETTFAINQLQARVAADLCAR